jgi:predicted N-acyltransferase
MIDTDTVIKLQAGTFTVAVFSSIATVPKDIWDALAITRSVTFSHDFWSIIEESKLNDFSYRYALFYAADGLLAGIASFYSITTDIAIFAPRWLRLSLEQVRRLWPRFLKLSMIECGTPIILNSPGYVVAAHTKITDFSVALDAVLRQVARQEKNLLIVIRDFEPDTAAHQVAFAQRGYSFVSGLPNTYMDLPWQSMADYFRQLKSDYRSKQLRHVKRIEASQVRCEVIDDFAAYSDILCAQWLVVHQGADEFKREILTPIFYRALAEAFQGQAKILLFFKKEELLGHALMLQDGTLMRWLYFGRAVAANDSLYLYAGHKVIETSINAGAAQLELGLTTYSIKQDLGAHLTPIAFAIKSPLKFLNPFIGFFYKVMNKTPKITKKQVFKS